MGCAQEINLQSKVYRYDKVGLDLISKVVLEDMFCTHILLPRDVKEFWYLKPGKTTDVGLRRVEDDKQSVEMMKCTKQIRFMCMWYNKRINPFRGENANANGAEAACYK